MTKKYTIFLPKTSFVEQGKSQEKQVEIRQYWQDINLEKKIKNQINKNLPNFVLHLGPPYANGDLHQGHLLNYILKDFAIRAYRSLGYNVEAVQGWDCHGLPIELKVEAEYKKNNIHSKSILDFRHDCKKFAEKWIEIQKQSLKIFGFAGQLDSYYTTMELSSQLSIIKAFFYFLKSGYIYRKKKTTMWSTVERTTLSEAEINYQDDHISTSVYFVSRLIKVPKNIALQDQLISVWTTTPWTLFGNNGYAYNPKLTYQLIRLGIFMIIVEEGLVNSVMEKILKYNNIETDNRMEILLSFKGSDLEGAIAEHPLFNYEVPLMAADFVGELDKEGNLVGGKGTGLVHIAGAHGIEDFNLSVDHNLEFHDYLDEEGKYLYTLPVEQLQGEEALKKQGIICEMLGSKLLAKENYKHRYPYSERGKNPIIFKLTSQWFIDIEKSKIREDAIAKVDDIKWIPEVGKNKMSAALRTRKEWLLSRQRMWGVPIMWFIHKETGDILQLPLEEMENITNKIINIVEKESYDFWYKHTSKELCEILLPENLRADYIPAKDIVDVWFESGMTHDYVVRKDNKTLNSDLVIEGIDQTRGWFNSMLLTSSGLDMEIPFKSVLMHGFVVDKKKEKLSKSLGNASSLVDCINNLGGDISRIWIGSCDYTEEVVLSEEMIKRAQEFYINIRNRFKFLLGVLNNADIIEVNYDELPQLEKYILAKIVFLSENIKKRIHNYQFREVFLILMHFINEDLSKLYFMCRKDTLYCDEKDSINRQSCIFVMSKIMEFLLCNFRIFVPFITEEVFQIFKEESILFKDSDINSVHLLPNMKLSEKWANDDILEIIKTSEEYIKNISKELESVIQKSIIKNKSEAKVTMAFDGFLHKNKDLIFEISKIAELCEDSSLKSIVITNTSNKKCDRCWNYVILNNDLLCKRCSKCVIE